MSHTSTYETLLRTTVTYELCMLDGTFSRLQAGETDEVRRNALIEAFCLHARQLLEFFGNKQGLRAEVFTGGTYAEVHTSNIDMRMRARLNHQISHLSKMREVDRDRIRGPDLVELHAAIFAEAKHFQSKLVPPFQWWTAPASSPSRSAAIDCATTSTTATLHVWHLPARGT